MRPLLDSLECRRGDHVAIDSVGDVVRCSRLAATLQAVNLPAVAHHLGLVG
jgi:hypothetical protein